MLVDIVEVWNDFRSGDKKAFSFLYESYFDILYRYGIKFIVDEDVLKDCIHDLFVKLYHNRESLSATENPKFYLLFALKNLIIDYLSRHKRMTYVPSSDLKFYITFQYESDNDADEIDDEIKNKYDKVMSLLNDRQKEALYLRFMQELSYEEISRMLDINYQSARNLIHRSILKVRENMPLSVFLLLFS